MMGMIFNDYIPVAAACLLLVAYTLFASRCAAKVATPHALLSTAATQVYLLGHLYTLSGLLGAALRFSVLAEANSTPQGVMLTVAALKLTTSVVGLIAMFYLRPSEEDEEGRKRSALENMSAEDLDRLLFGATQSDRDQMNAVKRMIAERTSKVAAQLQDFQQCIVHFGKTITQADGQIVELQNRTVATGYAFQNLEGHIEESSRRLENANGEVQAFSRNINELQLALDDFTKVVESKIEVA